MAVPDIASVPTTKTVRGGGALSTAIDRNKDVAIVLFLSLLLYLGLFPLHFPFDNQSTYLLSGLASSGYGNLSEDWVSNTKTPFFLFSRIIAALSDIGFLGGIRLLSFLLALVFSASGLMIFRHCRPDAESSRSASLMFVLILLTVAIYDQFMLRGMAGQYVLGMYLQPSEFGVFLILSVALFVVGKPILPYIFVAVAGVFHQSYLLVGAFLVISFFSYELFFGKRIKEALIGSVAALAIVSPVLWYSYVNFSASDAEIVEQSRRIIAEYRIPHHADPMRWFDATQAKKILVIVLATVLSYFVDRRLTFVMASSAVLGALASLAALLIDSNTLYLLFPWRVSVVLMPLATIVLVLSVVRIVTDTKWAGYITGRWASAVMILLAAALSATSLSGNAAGSGVYQAGQTTVGHPRQDREAEYLDLIQFVRSQEAEAQVYLHNPTRFFSFRIRSGAAAYVDFKSHPYRDVEVVEWWSRWQWAFRLFSGRRACDPSLLDEIGDLGITHIIIDKAHDHDTVVACIANGSASTALAHDNALYSVVQIAR